MDHHLTFKVERITLLTSTREWNSPPLMSEGETIHAQRWKECTTTVKRVEPHTIIQGRENACKRKELTTTSLEGWRPYLYSGGGRVTRALSRRWSHTPCIKKRGGGGGGCCMVNRHIAHHVTC